jgi:short-subunit dehydrogenase
VPDAEERVVLDAYAERWALVTGASSGIGAEFARRLAARGMHLVLTARRRELMEELADELHTRHGTRVEIVTGDLSRPDQAKALLDEIAARRITLELLVNNAGFGIVADAANIDVERVMELLRLNIGALTELTCRVLPGMLERGHGAVLNLSSLAGFQPVAYMAAYAASKAYVLHFSEALWAEVRERGVTVTAVCPGITRTSFFDVAGAPGWLRKYRAQSPEQVVKSALKALEKRRPYVVPGWRNHWLSLRARFATRRLVVTESMKYFRPKKKAEPPPDEHAGQQPPGEHRAAS